MLILLTGNDTYTMSKKLKELRTKFTREVDPSNLNSTHVRSDALEPGLLRREITASPFLARRRMVVLLQCFITIVSNNELSVEWNELKSSIESTDPHSPIVIVVEEQMLEEKKKSKKPSSASTKGGSASGGKATEDTLLSFATRIECWIKNSADIVALAQSIAKERGLSLHRSALERIAELPPDAWTAATLMETVASFHGDNPTPITAAEVDQFATTSADDVLFLLQDALGTRNTKLLVRECAQKLASGVHPLVILAAMHRTLLLLRQAKTGELPSSVHPFVARKITEQSRRWDLPKLKTIAGKAMVGDLLMKSSSGLSPETILLRLVMSV